VSNFNLTVGESEAKPTIPGEIGDFAVKLKFDTPVKDNAKN